METKKKRGRPKKVQLPEEIKELINNIPTEPVNKQTTELINEPITDTNISNNIIWDFPIDQQIEFFDTNMSYELTGYRPIDNTHGLDFDPKWFTEVRDTYNRTGHYTEYRYGTKAYSTFWDQEYHRCKEGMTVNGYTITGDHYYFLNYYQLMNLNSVKKAGTSRLYTFPDFYVAQYQWFHYLELCKRLLKNACLMKARGIGFSEIMASSAACAYNCFRNSVTVIAAQQEIYVKKTLSKVWNALTWTDDHTDGGMLKLSQVKNTEVLRKASFYKVNANGQKVEDGWMSQIQGITADKPNKIRGDRTDLLFYEEAGSWPSLRKAWIQGEALVNIQGKKFGIKLAGGTGGDSGASLEGLRDMYYNPITYDILPFRHKYTSTGDEVLTGFFIPAFLVINKEGYIDKRGYTDPIKGKQYYDSQRALKSSNPKALIDFMAEFCYNAEEAFNLEGDNKFNKVNIAEQLTNIRALKKCPTIETGFLEYKYKEGAHIEQNLDGFKWIPNQNGKIKILEHPLWNLPEKRDEDGNVIWRPPEKIRDLYVIGIDGIDIGKSQTSEYTKDPSDFCLVVYKRTYGISEPQFVAIYKDRPDDIRESYKIAIKLAQYYNAIINIEATRQSIIPYARERKLLKLFMKRPRATLGDSARNTNKQYGTPATPAIINHQTDLIADYVNDYCHLIWFEEMLDELNRYNDENKRKFDIIASMAMALLADEELQGIVPRNVEEVKQSWQDIGFYIDAQGRKRYGVIPKQNSQILISNEFGQLYDDTRIRTSNTRLSSGYL